MSYLLFIPMKLLYPETHSLKPSLTLIRRVHSYPGHSLPISYLLYLHTFVHTRPVSPFEGKSKQYKLTKQSN